VVVGLTKTFNWFWKCYKKAPPGAFLLIQTGWQDINTSI
jgi:hypothetical protein